MTTYILDTETTGLIEPHMTEAAYSIVDIINGKVTVLQAPRAKRFNPLKEISLGLSYAEETVQVNLVN